MYRAKESFTTKNYDVKRKQILQDNFTTQDEINEFLEIGYIEEYNGTMEITENGTYDVKDYESADVNVSGGEDISEYLNTTITKNTNTPDTRLISQIVIKLLEPINISDSVSNLSYAFQNTYFEKYPKLIFNSNVTDVRSMFAGCSKLKQIDLSGFDTRNIQFMQEMFSGCSANNLNLDISGFDLASVTNMQYMFYNCVNLSNEGFNNILKALPTATSLSTKTLKYIGLSSSQATTCTGLSNWAAAEAAGWSTGY